MSAALNEPAELEAGSTRKRRKAKKDKRQRCGYTEDRPDMCSNCQHYQRRPGWHAECTRHEFAVSAFGFCNDYRPAEKQT